MSEKPTGIFYNAYFETYEAHYLDGRIVPLRDSYEANKLAEEFRLAVQYLDQRCGDENL